MFAAFYRDVPHVKPVLFGKRNAGKNVAALNQTHYNGLRIVSRHSDGSIEVSGEFGRDDVLILPSGASVRIS